MTGIRNSRGQFATTRKPPPPLEYRSPDCPMCNKEVDHDGDGFRCYDCEAAWPSDNYDVNGEWTSDPWGRPEVACPSMIEPHNTDRLSPEHESIRHMTEACILPDDHGGKHRAVDSWWSWEDDDPRIVKVARETVAS